ncbi:MAG: hypothetical protein ACXWLZ_02955 [Rhizomicrobium sp.]
MDMVEVLRVVAASAFAFSVVVANLFEFAGATILAASKYRFNATTGKPRRERLR